MLDERDELFAGAGCSSLDSVMVVSAAAQKWLSFFPPDDLKESSEALKYSERAYCLLRRADASENCKLVPCTDDALKGPSNAMGVPLVQLSSGLQRGGNGVFP